jgi:large subunit ribosomal protein L13e
MKAIKAKVPKHPDRQRLGRGFSRDELKKAGTSLAEALKLGIPIDPRRKTMHEDNVAVVETFLKDRKAASKPKKKPKS